MKLALMFAGQGAQKVGMGYDLYQHSSIARTCFDQTNLPFDLKEVCFFDQNQRLLDTTYVQPCLLTTSVALAQELTKELANLDIAPTYVFGLSLGEYSALTYAGAMNLIDAQQIVFARGSIMDQALPKGTTGMAAVLQLDAAIIKDICVAVSNEGIGVVEIANYNCPGQIVISGENAALQLASERCLAAGARKVMPLPVRGAFHSSLLQNASNALSSVLSAYVLKQPSIPVIYNVSGQEESQDLQVLLCKQMHSSVYFEQSVRYAIHHGIDTFVEIGPGTVLSGFVNKIKKEFQADIAVHGVEDMASIQKVIAIGKERMGGEQQ